MQLIFELHVVHSSSFLEIKVEVKTEDDQQEDNQGTEDQQRQDEAARTEQVKVEADKGGQYSRKRPYEESRSYGYYEHREEKRCAYHKLLNFYINSKNK